MLSLRIIVEKVVVCNILSFFFHPCFDIEEVTTTSETNLLERRKGEKNVDHRRPLALSPYICPPPPHWIGCCCLFTAIHLAIHSLCTFSLQIFLANLFSTSTIYSFFSLSLFTMYKLCNTKQIITILSIFFKCILDRFIISLHLPFNLLLYIIYYYYFSHTIRLKFE